MNPRIVLLPGLGADHRLFEEQKAALPNVVVPSWPELDPNESLPAFAKRVAESLPKSELLYVGGSSFGGMVALEVAALLRPKGVLLIGSCRGPEALGSAARGLGTFVPAAPTFFFEPRPWLLNLVVARFGRLSPEQRTLFLSMAATKSAAFLKWGVRAILSWRPTPVAVPVRHIHGDADHVIPIGNVSPDRVIPGGGHLLSLTHATEVNAFILDAISDAR